MTRIDINHALGKLFEALAANRVSLKRAATPAYIGPLLLQSEANRWDAKTFRRLVDIKFP
jgi:hypothetical protein